MPGDCKLESDACDQCFRTRQSCSRQPIQCQRCAELGSSCTYSFGKFMGRPKKSLKSRNDGTSRKQQRPPIHINTSNTTLEGADEVQYPTPRSVPPTKSDSTQYSDWWQCSRNDNSGNDRTSSDDAESRSVKEDRNQRSTSKQAAKTSACDQCYRFKVKCTREPDCCQRCSSNGNACTYSTVADTERSRKRQAPGTPLESPAKKMALTSQSKPTPVGQGKLTAPNSTSNQQITASMASSTTSDSSRNDKETLCSLDTLAVDTGRIQPSTPHPQGQTAHPPHQSGFGSEYQPPTVLHKHANITDDNLSFYDTSQYYSDRPLPLLPSHSLDFLFESETPTYDINFELDEDKRPEQLSSNELCSKPPDLNLTSQNSVSTSCGCLQSVTNTLSTLHSIVLSNSAPSFDSIFAAARSGLSICKSLASAQCNSCQPGSTSALTMLCVAILQHVYSAYELLEHPSQPSTEGRDDTGKKIAFSIKMGDIEFADIGHNSSIMRVILKMEKARAGSVCVELEKMITEAPSRDAPGAGKDDKMVRDGLIGLLRIYREQFTTEGTE